MNVIDCVDFFTEIQRDVMFDRQLIEEFGLTLAEVDSYIIIDDRMFAFIPDLED